MTDKILVIEDAHLLRNDILETLKLEGFDVIGAENGRDGLRAAFEHRPDLIICDIMMPELDGYAVLDELRKDPEMAMTPFIFMTAKTEKNDIRMGMGKGADDYLTKPFLTTDLLNTIRARLGKRALIYEQTERKLDQLRQSIITALPHEFRTPLNTIIGFSEILLAEGSVIEVDQIREWAEHVNNAALRLYRLVENYLAYVRIETLSRDLGKVEALRANMTVNAGSHVYLLCVQQAHRAEREEDLVLDIQEVEGVRMSEQDLGKLVVELIDNAFKFSPPGTPVQVQAMVIEDDYVIQITDHGHGMTREQIDAIGAYVQFDRWLYEQQGMGLGLAIAKRLAQLYGGSLTIQSVVGEETIVITRLPTT